MELPHDQGNEARWNSIVLNVLKPIGSGFILSPSSLERDILNSYLIDCQNRHKVLCSKFNLTDDGSEATSQTWPPHVYRDRIVLAERYERCQIALAPGPIRRLPPEIFSEIFRHCLPQLLHRPDPSVAPLLICRISSLWRDIAHATRSLWNCLDFTDEQKPGMKYFIQLSPTSILPTPPLQQWLSHTTKSRLDLSFDRWGTETPPELVSATLLPNVADVFRLEIHLPLRGSHGPFQHFSLLPPHTLRSLKYLILNYGLDKSHLTVFKSPPHLTHLSLDDLDFAFEAYRPGEIPALHTIFPWPQLTHLLVARYMEPGTLLSALLSCQSLEVASVCVDLRGDLGDVNDITSDSEDENQGHICSSCEIPTLDSSAVLHYLRELDITIKCGQSFPLQNFHFPALRALRVHRGHMPQIPISQQRLTAAQPDNFSWKNSLMCFLGLESLEILSLAGRVGSAEEVVTLLQHIPAIDFLDLNLSVNHHTLFPALTIGMQAHPTSISLPRLNCLRLVLEPGDMPSFSEAALRELVLSRSRPIFGSSGTKFENLVISSSCFPRDHSQNLRKIVENANSYIKATFEGDTNASRSIPWKRYAGRGLWRTQ